jgi:hypothetical protein
MKQAIDSHRGRELYGRRIAIIEPVFANLRHNKRLDLYCLVHNIEKLAHHGYGGRPQANRRRKLLKLASIVFPGTRYTLVSS